jgi:hypothetical protein
MAASQIPYSPSYLELIDFALKGKTPQEVLSFRPTPQQIERISNLRQKEHDGTITDVEIAELDTADQLEHLVIMMKKQAAKQLAG